jgi:hypothetical protein
VSSRAPILALVLVTFAGCDPKKASGGDDEAQPSKPSASASAPLPPTPRAAFSATPVSQFVDAGEIDGKSPYEQAKEYEATGQLWMARLILEKKALAPDATREETELLARICNAQGDDPCVAECSSKLGKKLKFDAGAPKGADAGREHKEPDTDVARARDLFLKKEYAEARKLLEPKVLDGKATKDEIRILKMTCERQGDRMCTALCDAKLR